jgi:DNA repair exonuclease SbcCD nuclease subunit
MQIIMNENMKAKEIGFHKYIFGHYHTPFNHPLYSCCGSVSGTDAYDHKSGRYSDPSQSAWMVHPKHGEFDRTDFNLKYI